MFESIAGLPAHPLIVHAPVVLPLVAIGVILLNFKKTWRPKLATALFVLLAVAAATSILAMVSGNALAELLGDVETHRLLGTVLAFSSIGYLALAGTWLWLVRRESAKPRRLLGWLSAAASVAILVLTVLAGHSGASAAWSGTLPNDVAGPESAAPASPSSPAVSPSTSGSASVGPVESSEPSEAPSSSPTGYTLAEVATHNTQESCWAAISGTVYDLTAWIGEHPGGDRRIVALCGTDATEAFEGQHASSQAAAEALTQFELGPLVG